MTKTVDIMVVAAHPDDAEFGAGGVVAMWTKKGRQVVYVVCTNGDKGTSDRDLQPERLVEIRKKEQMEAADLLGVKDVEFLGYADQSLEDTPRFRKEIVRVIRRHCPRIVVTSDPYRRYLWHRDHRITGQVTLDAVFPYARDHLSYPDLLAEGLEPHKVQEIWFWASEGINHRCDITETFDLKIAALRCHESQFKGLGGAGAMEAWVRERCREMAQEEDFELAEGFHRVEVPG